MIPSLSVGFSPFVLSVLGENAGEVGCALLSSQSMEPWLLSAAQFHAVYMISDITAFSFNKAILILCN